MRIVARTVSLMALAVACGCKSSDATSSTLPSVAVTVTGANTISAGGTVTLAVSVSNFTLVDPGDHDADVAGEGHYHVYLDGATGGNYLTVDFHTSALVAIPLSTPKGTHSLKVQLVTNTAAPLSPDVSRTVSFTVQ